MPSTPAYYTDLFLKRGDISGSNKQAFVKGKDVFSYVIRDINANTITAIGTIAPGTSIVQYLFAPKIHHDLDGTPKMIIQNVSNKLGEFSFVAMPLASLTLFGCITNKDKVDGMMPYESDFKNNALVNRTGTTPVQRMWSYSSPTSSSSTLVRSLLLETLRKMMSKWPS